MTYKHLIIYLSAIVLVVAACDFGITYIVEKAVGNNSTPKIGHVYNADSEIAIIGGSRAQNHYIPQILSDSLNMSAYNYGIGDQNIFVHYVMLRLLTEHALNKPKLVVLDISEIDVNNSPNWNTEKLSILYPYFSNESSVQELLSDVIDPKELFIIKVSGLYRHNSNYLNYLKQCLSKSHEELDCLHGYSPLANEWDQPIGREEEYEESAHPDKVRYLNKFIGLCKEENIKLIIAVSPYFKLFPERKWVNELERITKSNNVPFLYHEKDSMYLCHGEWFNEPIHLNDKGAQIYSMQIGHEIKSLLSK